MQTNYPRAPVPIAPHRRRTSLCTEEAPTSLQPPAQSRNTLGTIAQDLQLFHQSLKTQPEVKTESSDMRVLTDKTGWNANVQAGQAVRLCEVKSNLNRTGKDPNGGKHSMHRSKVNPKPNTIHSHQPENSLMRNSELISLKARIAAKPVDLQDMANPALSKSLTMQNTNKVLSVVTETQPVINSVLQVQIEQLAYANKEKEEKIKELEKEITVHIIEKDQMAARINKIQLQVNELWQNKDKGPSLTTNDAAVWTCPVVRDNCTQTVTPIESVHTVRQSVSFVEGNLAHSQGEDWFSKAKQFKAELEQEKMVRANLEIELKTGVNNARIQTEQRCNRLQRQHATLQGQYERKCKEVKEKQELIQRLLPH